MLTAEPLVVMNVLMVIQTLGPYTICLCENTAMVVTGQLAALWDI